MQFERQAQKHSPQELKSTMIHPRKIAVKFVAGEQAEGVGVTVRRSIGSSQLRNLDPFLMLDEAVLALPAGFPAHPHRGFETVSYILPTSKGHTRHEDFLGNKGMLRPGDLQWMTAGRGIVHAEMPATELESHGLQLWVNLPKSHKMTAPAYQEVSRDTVPHSFENGVEALVFAGEAFGVKGPIETRAPVTYVHFILQKNGQLAHSIPVGHNAFVYVLSGGGYVAGEAVVPHEACVLEVQGDGVEISTDNDNGLQCLVISGQPLNEPVVQYGPFVMNTKAEIRETFGDYQEAKNGFENARTWTPSTGN